MHSDLSPRIHGRGAVVGAVEHGRVRACTSADKRPTLTYVHQWLVLMDFHYFHIFTNCDCKLII